MKFAGLVLLSAGLAWVLGLLAGCSPSPLMAPPFETVLPATSTPLTDPRVYRSETAGFTFTVPRGVGFEEADGGQKVMLIFQPRPGTNLVEETGVVSVQPSDGCRSPLAKGRDPALLAPRAVTLNGLEFLREEFAGAAAGTASLEVSYRTVQGAQCVLFYYLLRTFDPANLDPTRFPTLPVVLDVRRELQTFERLVATFQWLP